QVVIHELPEAEFSASTVCLGCSTLLTEMSFDSTGNINSWNWSCGDGNSSLWSTGQTTAGITVNPSATTFYFVTVTDANGCQDADTVMAGVGSVPLVSLADAFICTGNSVALNAGNPGCTYLWST